MPLERGPPAKHVGFRLVAVVQCESPNDWSGQKRKFANSRTLWLEVGTIARGRAIARLSERLNCRLDFSLLGDFKRIIHLNAEIAHGGLKLGVTKKKLHSAQVLGSPVDQRCLGSSHRVRAIFCWVKTELLHPAT